MALRRCCGGLRIGEESDRPPGLRPCKSLAQDEPRVVQRTDARDSSSVLFRATLKPVRPMKAETGKPVVTTAAAGKAQPRRISKVKPLSNVVLETKQVQELVAECRDDLAEVNARMRSDLDDPLLPNKTAGTLQRSVALQAKVGTVSDRVATITDELIEHVRDRRLMDSRFVAVVEQEAAARHAALHDYLTGLPNRALWEDRIKHGLSQARRHDWGMGVLFIDLDAFKEINDSLGHAAGDRVLVSVAQRLLEHARSDDTVARYGGDEFACLLLEIKSEGDAAGVAQSILDVLHRPHELGSRDRPCQVTVRASIGIALFPQHGDTAEVLLRAADAAMYRAKRSGSGYALASSRETFSPKTT